MQPVNVIEGVWEQGTTPKVLNLSGQAFYEEAGAHRFEISAVTATGVALTLSGTVTAKYLRADGTTVALDGSISSGKAVVTLVSDCYHVPGRYSIAIYVTTSGVSTCVYAACGIIFRTSSDTVIDSGATIPTLAQLEQAYADCVDATAAATTATDAADAVAQAAADAKTYASATWQQGTINGSTGADGAATNLTRIRTVGYIRPRQSGYVTATVASGYEFSLRFYSDAASPVFARSTDWITSASNGVGVAIGGGECVRFVLRASDDADVAPSAGSNLTIGFTLSGGVLAESIAPTDHETAVDAHAAGDYLMVDGKLCRATSAISAGDAVAEKVETATVADGLTVLDTISQQGKNLFTGQLEHYGFSSGTLVVLDNCRSFVWPVTKGETYTVSRASTAAPDRLRVAFALAALTDGMQLYSLRGQAESPWDEATGLFDALTTKTFTVPNNQNYVYGIMYLSNDSAEVDDSCELMLVKGGTAAAWQPYKGTATAVDVVARDGERNIIQRNDPDDMLVKLQQLNRPTRTGSRTLGTPPLCLLHFSDIHGDEYCLRNIAEFRAHYGAWIDDVIHTGDIVTTYAGDGMAFWDNVSDASNYLNCIGNHDTRKNSDNWSSTQTAAESLAAYITPYVSNWGVTIGNGVCYYYKDYASQKVRLIVLDVMHDDATQRAWFVSTLAGANAAGYHVIAAAHCMASNTLTPFVTPWDDKPAVPSYSNDFADWTNTNYPQWLDTAYITAVDDFQTAGGYFVCWLHGHTHFKVFAKVTGKNQLSVGVANAGGTQFAWTYVQARHQGTRSADDFNLIAVDTDSNVLRLAKVGVNYDRFMRHTDAIAYNYDTGEML